jgi:hypothetical protein
MVLLKSRVLPNTFALLEGLQLGKGITYAEEQFRNVLRGVFGENAILEQREIIIPKKVCRPEILHDPSGVVLKSDLLESIARHKWEILTNTQRLKVDSAAYNSYRQLQNDDFEARVVFFRATVRLGESPESQIVHVIARVEALAVSGWWNMATVRMWHLQDGKKNQGYIGAEYLTGGPIYVSVPEKPWSPPRFLIT